MYRYSQQRTIQLIVTTNSAYLYLYIHVIWSHPQVIIICSLLSEETFGTKNSLNCSELSFEHWSTCASIQH